MSYDHQYHADLCRRAAAGDAEAANDLARESMPMVRNKSRYYARIYAPAIDADELESAGLSKFTFSVKSYDASRGVPWLGYFAAAMARAMVAAAERAKRRRKLQRPLSKNRASEIAEVVGVGGGTEDVFRAIGELPDAERALVSAVFPCIPGVAAGRRRTRGVSQSALAKSLRLTHAETQALLSGILRKIRMRVEEYEAQRSKADKSKTAKIIAAAIRMKKKGAQNWRSVIVKINQEYGTNYTYSGFLSMVSRRRGGGSAA